MPTALKDRINWTEEKDASLLRLKAQEWPHEALAKHFNTTEQAITSRLHQLRHDANRLDNEALQGVSNILNSVLPPGHAFVLVAFDSDGKYRIMRSANSERSLRYLRRAVVELEKRR